MDNYRILLLVILVTLLTGCSSVSPSPAPKIVSGVVTNVVSAVFKWLWSLKSTPRTAISSRSMMKFESGYVVDTVFDGSKLGIEPFALQVLESGELLVLDSENSNIYEISSSLSRYSRPKLVAGSAEGYTGHVDGKPREARMYHPKGLTADNRGNLYVADNMNMAIRKISDTGVVTIAGGKSNRGGHIDGPNEDARFSNDFDVVYVGSRCSLLVIDRGNQAIREIQLHEDDCSSQYEGNLHLGRTVLASAVFFGYMVALLQRRVSAVLSHDSGQKPSTTPIPSPYQRPPKSVRPPLIPNDDEYEKQEDGIFSSVGRLLVNTGSTFFEFVGGLFSGFRRKPSHHLMKQQNYYYTSKHGNSWPLQESFVIPHEDEPPPIESRDPTPRKSQPFMAKDVEKTRQQFMQNQSYYSGWNRDFDQQPPHYHQQLRHNQYHQKHQTCDPQTYYEQGNCETNEIVFGAVQEQDDDREAVVVKAVDYGEASIPTMVQWCFSIQSLCFCHLFLRIQLGYDAVHDANMVQTWRHVIVTQRCRLCTVQLLLWPFSCTRHLVLPIYKIVLCHAFLTKFS